VKALPFTTEEERKRKKEVRTLTKKREPEEKRGAEKSPLTKKRRGIGISSITGSCPDIRGKKKKEKKKGKGGGGRIGFPILLPWEGKKKRRDIAPLTRKERRKKRKTGEEEKK